MDNPEQMPKVHHQPINVSNQFSPLSDTLAEKPMAKWPPILIIGSLIVRNVTLETPAAIVKYIPGARPGNVESCLKVLSFRLVT